MRQRLLVLVVLVVMAAATAQLTQVQAEPNSLSCTTADWLACQNVICPAATPPTCVSIVSDCVGAVTPTCICGMICSVSPHNPNPSPYREIEVLVHGDGGWQP